jgi:hypothetical protein
MEDGSTLIAPCRKCGRELFQPVLGRALRTCPVCDPPQLPYSHDALRRVARNERKRIRARVAVAVTAVLSEAQLGFRKWPADLMPTVRVLDRWGSFGTGLPAHESGRLPPVAARAARSRYAGGRHSVHRARSDGARRRRRTHAWCRRRCATSRGRSGGEARRCRTSGRAIGMPPRSFGRYVEECLVIHRRAFMASRHADLVALMGERA